MIERDGPGAATLGGGDRASATAAVKDALNVGAGGDDALIATFAETALCLAEQFTGCVTIARALYETLPESAAWRSLGAAPVRMIAGVERSDGTALPPGAYAVDIDADGDGWIRTTGASEAGLVAVRYAAGIADDWPSLPAALRQGVVLLAAHLYDTRDGAGPPPAAVTALWRPFRRLNLRRVRSC